MDVDAGHPEGPLVLWGWGQAGEDPKGDFALDSRVDGGADSNEREERWSTPT